MRIGLISDVHGNAPALNAVLSDMDEVDAIIHAGDVIGYNPYPSEVIAEFQAREIESINGNHDRALINKTGFGFNSLASEALSWTESRLTNDEIRYIEDLPQEMYYMGGEIKVVHGSPENPDRYVYPADFNESMLGDEDLLVLGHTHVQGKEEYEQGVIVNPGSVGQPRDRDPKAGYGVYESGDGSVELWRVEYDIDEVAEKIRDLGLPERLASRLYQGR